MNTSVCAFSFSRLISLQRCLHAWHLWSPTLRRPFTTRHFFHQARHPERRDFYFIEGKEKGKASIELFFLWRVSTKSRDFSLVPLLLFLFNKERFLGEMDFSWASSTAGVSVFASLRY